MDIDTARPEPSMHSMEVVSPLLFAKARTKYHAPSARTSPLTRSELLTISVISPEFQCPRNSISPKRRKL